MEEGGKEGSWHQEQIENDLLCACVHILTLLSPR